MNSELVAGVDSSTQSCKIVMIDPSDGSLVRQGRATHPDGTEIDPRIWWQALLHAIDDAGGLNGVTALSIGGQQHGLVCLDNNGNVIRDALLWNDTRSASSAQDLIIELGNGDQQEGAARWAAFTGSVPVASLTITKLRWIADNEPEIADRIAAICLPHDYLTWRVSGSSSIYDLTTDRSDASGTGYMDIHTNEYRYDLLELALRKDVSDIVLPRILPPFEVVGTGDKSRGWKQIKIGPGCGDNAGAALGLDLSPGVASISLGTSGVVAAVSPQPVCDPSGLVTGFADATGNWLPLACTLNASRIIDATCTMLGCDYKSFDDMALKASAQGVEMTPYFEGERTPNLPDATASITGLTLNNTKPENIARAAVEGLGKLMKGALNAVVDAGCVIDKAVLVGGGAKSRAVQQILPSILGIPVTVAPENEYVALGAAKQALLCLK